VVFRWDLKEPGESVECRSGLCEFNSGPHTENIRDAKLDVTAGLKNRVVKRLNFYKSSD